MPSQPAKILSMHYCKVNRKYSKIITKVDDNFYCSYNMLKAEDVARATVDGILFNETIVSISFCSVHGIKLFNLAPFWFQHFISDYIRGEAKFLALDEKKFDG